MTLLATLAFTLIVANCMAWLLVVFNIDKNDRNYANEVWLWLIAALCQRGKCSLVRQQFVYIHTAIHSFVPGGHESPQSIRWRIMFITLFISGPAIYVPYSAKIFALQADRTAPIKTFADLIQYGFIFSVHKSSKDFRELLDVRPIQQFRQVNPINCILCVSW